MKLKSSSTRAITSPGVLFGFEWYCSTKKSFDKITKVKCSTHTYDRSWDEASDWLSEVRDTACWRDVFFLEIFFGNIFIWNYIFLKATFYVTAVLWQSATTVFIWRCTRAIVRISALIERIFNTWASYYTTIDLSCSARTFKFAYT